MENILSGVRYNPAKVAKRILAALVDAVIVYLLFELVFTIERSAGFFVYNFIGLAGVDNQLIELGASYGLIDSSGSFINSVSSSLASSYDSAYAAFSAEAQGLITAEYALLFLYYAIILVVPVTLVYFVVPLVFKDGKTLGKKLMHIKVISKNNTDVSIKQMAIRTYLGVWLVEITLSIIFYYMPILMSGFYSIIGSDKRAFHDYFAGTKVVDDVPVKVEETLDSEVKANVIDAEVVSK